MRKYSIILFLLGVLLLLTACVTQRVEIPEFTSLPDAANIYFSMDMQAEYASAVYLINLFLPDMSEQEVEKLLPRFRRVYMALYDEHIFIWVEASIPQLALSAALRDKNWDVIARKLWNNPSTGINIQLQGGSTMLIYSEKLIRHKPISIDKRQFLQSHPLAILIEDTQSYISTSYVKEIVSMRLFLTEIRTLRLEMEMRSDTVAKLALVFSRLLANTGWLFLIDGMHENIARTDNIVHAESNVLGVVQLSDIIKRFLQNRMIVGNEDE